MASYKVCFTLATILVSAQAAFNPALFDSFPSEHHSWASDDHLDFASSEHSSSYSPFSALKKRQPDYESSYEPPKDWFATNFKKEPREDKNYKKIISPVYTITEKDSPLYKDIVLKSGVPYCQESKSKRASKNKNAKDSLVCFKCKNPKNGSTYEQCSYVSQPLSESSKVEKVLEPPATFRFRRSSSEDDFKSKNYRSLSTPYRFNDKIFSDAAEDVPAEYKMKDEECEKVVKDSMVCMVCRDKKSNGKYEQCSYVSQPKEKKFSYSKSYKDPEDKKDEDEERSSRDYSEKKPVREASEKEDSEKLRKEASEPNCKKVEKDSKTCTICSDPKTGSKSEQCSYAYQPDDKVYKYTRSKSFGNKQAPSEDYSSTTQVPIYKSSYSQKPDYSSDYSVPEDFYQKSGSSYFKDREEPSARYQKSGDAESFLSDYEKSKSESERIAKSIEPSNCKEVEKDTMTCTMCKDPKTGAVSEQCSYKFQPSEKKFAYTKSKSFGNPTKSEDKSTEESEKSESKEPSFDGRYYGFTSDKAASKDTDSPKRDYDEFPSSSESKPEIKEQPSTESPVDKRFYDAFEKKAEIRKVLQDFQKEDRSNCKKLMRDKMTCYQCVDEKGFRQEECAFATTEDSGADKSEKTESKEDVEPSRKVPRSSTVDRRIDDSPRDSHAAATEVRRVKDDSSKNQRSEEETKGVDAYAYVAETRPVFDKVLGFTLPAYMLDTSEYEREFDKSVAVGEH
ncbi:uncharacterized protein LOC117223953 isoform X2 [Megalopta genalis]|uniref:uncharacterized protein LOC117223953 isoform X2 n=1 Tax=Megalopta genalis TaxID=115081 RepID=UPI003FD21DDE